MKGPERESAISPIIAEILMVALILLAAGIAYVFLFQLPTLEKIPMVAADITKSGNQVSFFFKNGDSLKQGTFYVTLNGDRVPDRDVSLSGGP
jgi:FlaG/FlaF family flagellin (archaellin)